MRILHWDEMFHPSFGYQINILPKYQVKQGHEVIILTSEKIDKHPTFSKFGTQVDIEEEDRKYMETYGVKIIRLPIYKVVSGRVIYKRGFINMIKKLKPDIILCHTNDTLSSMIITKKYKNIKIPIVFDNHMLEMASKNPLSNLFRFYYRTFITPILKKHQLVVIRTQDDNYVNKHLKIPKEQTPFLSFGSDTTLFYPSLTNKRNMRKKYDINENDFVVIYTGKLNESKGGKILADSFIKKFNTNKKVILIAVGNANGEYEKEVEKLFKKSANRILRFPTQEYVNLSAFYQMADLSVFPKQCSLSFYDAQASGLPVIAENNNINKGRLAHGNGELYQVNSSIDLREKIELYANMSQEEIGEISNNALNYVKKNYDYVDIVDQYTRVLTDEYNRFHEI
ncbi:hypothetical protein Plano_2324 [Planococcus sp. PAMC 21323]|uniref:glycosyltransferase family 4 protein n=1 Tax=Planococcus sp. PAMC 21323 TaxID=1526927 RepID=UPI00056FD08C|nr:glycosyltransferase family 4 protein [Planococcus sp. PAMC 21323]AIY06289.1 hypothetical protein Plano_2324 [Planococcus sp. PAMC 21323]